MSVTINGHRSVLLQPTSAFDLASGADPSVLGDTTPTLPAELRADVAEAYRLLEEMCAMDIPAVAVRSSAVDEDGRDASFAGQHETFLNVAGVDALMDA